MPNLHGRVDYASVAPMRPGRTTPYPGGDAGRRQTPGQTAGQASGFRRDSRCPQCGKTIPTTDEWGLDGGDGPSSYYYANVTGYPYGSAPTQTQQQSRNPCCPFCGDTWSTTAHPQQPPGTGLALALAPAQAEDSFYDPGDYYESSLPGHYPREEWHTGTPGAPHTRFNNASVAYQGPYSSMGTDPYGHYWQHQGPYSSSPSRAPYNFQSPYYSTMNTYDRANQGISAGSYPYRIPDMGMSGAARRRVHGTCDLRSLTSMDNTVDFLSVEQPISLPILLQPLFYEKYWWHGHELYPV